MFAQSAVGTFFAHIALHFTVHFAKCMLQNMFLAAATASLGILGAQYWGKGDKKTLDEIFCMALRLCGLVSAIFFVGCVFFGRYLMLIFTNEEVLINYGVSYLKIAGFSYLLTGISQCYLVIMKTSEHAKTTAVISSMTVCVNIILNAIFIFGGFGIAPMGVRGAALATLIARIIELCCSVLISNTCQPVQCMRTATRRPMTWG